MPNDKITSKLIQSNREKYVLATGAYKLYLGISKSRKSFEDKIASI